MRGCTISAETNDGEVLTQTISNGELTAMSRMLFKFVSLVLVLVLLTSCGAMKFITDAGKIHFNNESSYDVIITVHEPGEDDETFTLAPGKKEMVSIGADSTVSYSPSNYVGHESHEETWWDSYWGVQRTDFYHRYYDY